MRLLLFLFFVLVGCLCAPGESRKKDTDNAAEQHDEAREHVRMLQPHMENNDPKHLALTKNGTAPISRAKRYGYGYGYGYGCCYGYGYGYGGYGYGYGYGGYGYGYGGYGGYGYGGWRRRWGWGWGGWWGKK